MARELLNRPNGDIIAKNGYQEFAIAGIQKVFTCANSDDSIMNWAINLHECTGNIKR
ncbi:MAG: hypothetical protein IJA10_11500 [Lachnospiraceae bacterium]|nr:hypothetical protein [Lachnospiraceae bacterium]